VSVGGDGGKNGTKRERRGKNGGSQVIGGWKMGKEGRNGKKEGIDTGDKRLRGTGSKREKHRNGEWGGEEELEEGKMGGRGVRRDGTRRGKKKGERGRPCWVACSSSFVCGHVSFRGKRRKKMQGGERKKGGGGPDTVPCLCTRPTSPFAGGKVKKGGGRGKKKKKEGKIFPVPACILW